MTLTLKGLSGFLALFVAGLVVFKATEMGLLLGLLGLSVFVLLTMICVAHPDKMLIGLLFFFILVPADLAVKVGPLPRLGPTRLYMLAFVTAAFIRIAFRHRLFEGGKRNWPLIRVVVFYAAAAFLSAVLSVAPLVSIFAVLGRDVMEQFILFFILAHFFTRPDFWPRLKKALFLATAVVCAFTFFEAVTRFNPFVNVIPNWDVLFRDAALRCRATFFHPIALGCYLNFIFPFVLADLMGPARANQRFWLLALAGAMILASILTFSRAPWIMMALETMLMIIWRYGKNIYVFFLITIISTLFFIGLILAYHTNPYVNRLFEPILNPADVEDASSEGYRIVLILAVLEKLKGEHWLYGYGPNVFGLPGERWVYGFGPNAFDQAGVRAMFGGEERVLTSPDNHYIRILFEYGILGSSFFLMLLAGSVAVAVRGARRAVGAARIQGVACLVGILGFILVNWTVSVFSLNPTNTIFWLVVALASSLPLQAGTQPEAT